MTKSTSKKIKMNIFYLLLPLSIILIVASFIFRQHANIQLELAILAIFIYISFALIHHFFDKSLSLEIIIDYILISILATVILLGVVI
ncbi:hypothetical protein HYW46_05600 [Candidatus Daviesbacteria bacterium]|nr:hypothetical protein [Candidatus Daviesbacteria bacterium]